MLKRVLKRIAWSASVAVALPAAAAAGFGRWRPAYTLFAQALALAPGLPGNYLRMGFYRLTLSRCSLSSCISFGTIFSHPRARLGPGAYIGAYCVIGMADIGANCQIASGVQILSGRRQHVRTGGGISGAVHGAFTPVSIGGDCWIGAGSIVMADVGEGTTIGAGAVVTRPIPPRCVAVGNPARVVQPAHQVASSGAGDPAGVSSA